MHGHGGTPQLEPMGNAPGELANVSNAEARALPRAAAELATPLLLPDGTRLHQRAIRPDDAPRLQAFHHRLSHKAVFFRFFGLMPDLTDDLAGHLSLVDYVERMAIVVTPSGGADEPIIAVARYQRRTKDEAEFALAVEDLWQGRGVGPRLLSTLATYARGRGIVTLIGEVMYDNDRMLAMLRHGGFSIAFHFHDGRVEARLDISG